MTQVALITGGQRGIGLGIARALKEAGFHLALVAECNPEDSDVMSALETLGDGTCYVQHDLRNVENAPAVLDRIEAELGPVSTFVSNAGVPARVRGDMLDIKAENFDFTLDINLKGAFFLAQDAARRMLRQGQDPYRSVIFVTSASAAMASIERAEYCISKAGASMMAQLFAARLAADGIGVFEVRPGIITSGMTDGVRGKYTPQIEDGLVPVKRWGVPADIGQAVVPLVMGQMAFSTGAVIPVDGGLSIHRL
jgi:NAD(P)-dependent dehydrogenase (short-subunit alcohol dehydrogenase family)